MEWCDRTSLTHPKRVSYHKKSKKVLCDKHKYQFERHGKFIKHTRFDSNEILYDDGVILKLGYYNREGDLLGEFVVDKEDYRKIKDYKWFLKSNEGSIVSNITHKNKSISHLKLHNVIMNVQTDNENGIIVDHIDGNVLNNSKSNLRIANRTINSINKTIQSNNRTGVVGVVKGSTEYSWMPQIKINYKMIRLGTKHTFDEAVISRLRGEAKYFHEYSRNYNHDTNTIQLTYLSHDDNQQTYIEVDMDGNILKFEKLNKELKYKTTKEMIY